MYSTNTDIAQAAVNQHLGRELITSIDDTEFPAPACKRALPQAAKFLLSYGPWHFHRTITSMSSVTNDRSDEWAYKHELPNDHRYLIDIMDASSSGERVIWSYRATAYRVPVRLDRVGSFIYSNHELLKARIVPTAVSADYVTWPTIVQLALSRTLAWLVTMPITKDKRLAMQMEAEAMAQIGDAFAWDSSQIDQEHESLAGFHQARG